MGGRTSIRLLTGFHFGLAIVCLVFALIGELRLWALSFSVLCFSLAIQFLLIRRLIKQHIRKELVWMERALPELEQAVADYECAVRAGGVLRREPDDATRDEMRRLQDEITQARREG